MDKKDLTLGQPVKIYGYRRSHDGVITKIGRTLVTIKAPTYGETQFRIDTQQVNSDFVGNYFRTLPQVEEATRRDNALKALRDHGFEIAWSHVRLITTDTLERIIAALEPQPPA